MNELKERIEMLERKVQFLEYTVDRILTEFNKLTEILLRQSERSK